MINPEHYTYRVTWSEDDQEYVGLCAEFPSLSWLHGQQAKALKGIVRVVREVVRDLEANGEPVPEPLSVREYSGKFMARVPPHVHRRLVLRAAEENRSLNAVVSSILARG